MNIQIHSSISNMSTTGKQVLGDLQDISTPLVDLLVRESIQNSTDAAMPVAEGDDTVSVSYDVKSISNANINGLFEQISDKLDARYPIGDQSDCLVIRDCGTYGLTGYLRKCDVPQGEKWGNLIKLVYDIRKPQENSAAGGAWGLGKTVYYKLGVGIVVYYTRIMQDGKYESRLAACMVENEEDSQALLPACPLPDDLRPSGIAWWGKEDGFNKTIPFTDEADINSILQLFNVSPYYGTETGTTIIIPYLNTNKLMDTTRYTSAQSDDAAVAAHQGTQTSIRPWLANLPRFLWVAVQRWYYPRIDNKYYVEACGLRSLSIKINNRKWNADSMFPVFRLMQSLYNRAILDRNSADFEDFMTESPYKTYYEQADTNGKNIIRVNKYVKGGAGRVSYAKATQDFLGMTPPDNFASPFLFFDLDEISNGGCAIVAYTRKPGMVVWYDVVRGLPDDSGYILGHFALQSDSYVVDDDGQYVKSLEDYIRATEAANHKFWNRDDFNVTERIRANVPEKILKAFRPAPANVDNGPHDTGLGRLLGGFMPPRGFGYRPTKKNKSSSNTRRLTTKGSTYRIEQVGTPEYSSQSVTLRYSAVIPANCNPSFEMELYIATEEDKVISFDDLLKQMHMASPIEMTAVEVSTPEYFKVDLSKCHHMSSSVKVSLRDVNGMANKVEFSINNTDHMTMTFSITLEYSSLDMKPVILIN